MKRKLCRQVVTGLFTAGAGHGNDHAQIQVSQSQRGLGAVGSNDSPSGAAIASYLLFEAGFVKALMALGERDAYARKDELLGFFS